MIQNDSEKQVLHDASPPGTQVPEHCGESGTTLLAPLGRVLSSDLFLVLVLLLGAGLRLWHILALKHLPLFDVLIVDSWMYDSWAQKIAGGDWLGSRVFYQDPLYPYFLALLYSVFGRDLLLVRLVQGALGVATCGLVGVMGRRVAGRLAGNLAALFMALYVPAIFQEGEVEKTSLGVFLVTAALALAMRPSVAARFGCGIMLGLATLTRGNLIMFVPLAVLYFLAERNGRDGETCGIPWRDYLGLRFGAASLKRVAAFIVGVFLVFGPVTWRNHRVSGEWILTTSQFGQVFYTGNNPDNSTGGFVTPKFVRALAEYEEPDFRAAAEAAVGHAMTSREASRYWFGQAMRHISENPGFAMKVMLRKATLFLSDYEVPDAWDMYFLARYSPVLALPLPGMGLLVPLALVGAVGAFRSRREVRLLTGFVLIYGVSVIMFFVLSRYRLHVAPAMAVLGACSVPWLASVAEKRDARRALIAAVLAVAGGLLSFYGTDSRHYSLPNQVQSSINLASTYEAKGDLPSAERVLVEAQRFAPKLADATCQLGRLRFGNGRLKEAEPDLQRCVEMEPRYPEAWLKLGQLYQQTGRIDAAIAAYRKQLQIMPGVVDAEVGLAECQITIGSAEAAAARLAPLTARPGCDPRLVRLAAAALLAASRTAEFRALLQSSSAAGHPISEEEVAREIMRLTGKKFQVVQMQ